MTEVMDSSLLVFIRNLYINLQDSFTRLKDFFLTTYYILNFTTTFYLCLVFE